MQYDAIESVTAVAYLNTMSIGDGNDIICRDDIFKGKSPKKYFPFTRPGELFAYSFLKFEPRNKSQSRLSIENILLIFVDSCNYKKLSFQYLITIISKN